jgi:glycine betaine/choline ABC-type transport system substrate-binding protein
MAPIVRDDFLKKLSEGDRTAFEKLLNDVSAKLTTEELTTLGVEVAVNNRDVADVAEEWLKANGLLK